MNKVMPLFICACLTTSCATYHLSNQSLLEQFSDSRTETKVIIFIAPPYVFFPGFVKGNDVRAIICLDQNQKENVIPVTRRTGVRITKQDGTRTTFYFDTLLLKDSTISGSKTHFFNAPIHPIRLGDIRKIEIQK